MKQFNIATEKIQVDKVALLNAINSGKEFGITIQGEVIIAPFERADKYIYKGTMAPAKSSALSASAPASLSELFGTTYKINESAQSVEIDAALAWNEIVQFNLEHATFDDSTSDGIMDLNDEELEEMSWHGVEFGITNREISDCIEEHCEGMLFCYHTQTPYMFSSLVYIDDMACARAKVRAMIKDVIADKLLNDPEYEKENLTDDEAEAAAYFGVIEG